MDKAIMTPSRSDKNKNGFEKVWSGVKRAGAKVAKFLKNLWRIFLRSFASWVDPKLEPYRKNRKVASDNEKIVVEETTYAPVEQQAPDNRDDLFALIREAPMSVLSNQERKAMMAILSLPDEKVLDIMTPALKVVFVKKEEVLGPLVLDKLYRSGFTYFPVIDGRQHIIGILQTTLLNSLDVKDTPKAEEVLDPRVYYIRADYSLEQALKAFLRTGSQMMLVIDHYEKLVGMLTFAQIMDYLFNEKFNDDFERDDDKLAVAKRRLN